MKYRLMSTMHCPSLMRRLAIRFEVDARLEFQPSEAAIRRWAPPSSLP